MEEQEKPRIEERKKTYKCAYCDEPLIGATNMHHFTSRHPGRKIWRISSYEK